MSFLCTTFWGMCVLAILRGFRPGDFARMSNKAHTATLNRISRKLGVTPNVSDDVDIRTQDMIVEVETIATVPEAIARLQGQTVKSYIAITNKEGIPKAKSLVGGTSIGLMDPQGNVVVEPAVSDKSVRGS